METEIVAPVDIAYVDGRLRREAVGWARHPLHRCAFAPGLSRVARWNYWCVTNREAALTILVADVGYLGIVLVSFLELAARRPVERLYVRPGGLAVRLPDEPRGDVVLEASRLSLAMRDQAEELHVECRARTLFGRRIAVDLRIDRPLAHETLNVLVPWDETRFHFTSKQQALPARGAVTVDGLLHRFGPENEAFACLDFGRGRWPSRIEWNWAFASASRGGRTLGLNLGAKWTDGTGVTENGFVWGGRLHKLAEAVDFHYDSRDHLRPWGIRTRESDRVDLRFVPLRERAVRAPLGVVSAELHQCVGLFSGTLVTDSGERVEIADVLGQAESVRGRW